MERVESHNHRVRVGVYLLLALLLVALPPAAHAGDPARVLIYVELPATVEAATELGIGRLSLVGPDGPVGLSLQIGTLASLDLAGSQTLLVNALLPAGDYSGLRLTLDWILGRVGVAEVSPDPPLEGVLVPLELHAESGETHVLFLDWQPRAVDPDVPFHMPTFSTLPSRLPPLGALAFVTSRDAGSVILVDRLAGRVVGAIRVDDDPRDLAYGRADQFLYIALAGQDAIGVVDVLSLKLIKTVPVQFGDDPNRLLLSVDGSQLYVLSAASRTLTALTTGTLQQEFRVPVGEGPRSMAQDPVTREIYVACEGEGVIQVVDPREARIVRTLSLVSSPGELVIDRLDRRLYAGSTVVRRIQFLDLTEDGRAGEQTLCGRVSRMIYQPRTRRLFAGTPGCGTVSVLQPESDLEFSSIDLPGEAGLMAFDAEFRQLLIVLPDAGGLALCNPNRGIVNTVVSVGGRPFGVLVP